MAEMKILKHWKADDHRLISEGEPIGWFETTLEECLEHTEGSGFEKDTVHQRLIDGDTVQAFFALYKMENDCEHEFERYAAYGRDGQA